MTLAQLQRSVETFAGRLEHAAWIDPLAGALHSLGARLTRANPTTASVLSGTGFGHPLHPAMVMGPLGCWTGALVSDLSGEQAAAQRLTGVGIVLSVPALATGLSDWTDTSGAEQRVGVFHLAANSTAVLFYTASWRARRAGRHRAGRRYGVLGGLSAVLGGWLGGHLAYAVGVGVDTTAFGGGPTEWTPVVRDPKNPLSGSAGDVSLLIVERGEEITVLADRCTHRGGPLSDGLIDGDCVVCPWHGSRFSLSDGSVHEGPAVVSQPVYEVRVIDKRLEVRRCEVRNLRVNPTRPS